MDSKNKHIILDGAKKAVPQSNDLDLMMQYATALHVNKHPMDQDEQELSFEILKIITAELDKRGINTKDINVIDISQKMSSKNDRFDAAVNSIKEVLNKLASIDKHIERCEKEIKAGFVEKHTTPKTSTPAPSTVNELLALGNGDSSIPNLSKEGVLKKD
jgi:hypothetical protein